MTDAIPSRDDLVSLYLDQLPFEPYPVQEEALLAWFNCKQGVLVCAPTGMGKTLIAEAAMFEALHTRRRAYYTTPLIALTDQKFREMQEAAVRWGFHPDDVGLVTGNRRVNPDATVLVVVAEILLNRLLHPTAFEFDDVSAVVMDEFHNFADRERGIVWELSLELLPKHIRLLLLSATVGNSAEFIAWLSRSHGRKVQLVQSNDRRVPLSYEWVPDQLLNEQLQIMAAGDDQTRRTPALVFCFNREECWSVAEQLKGKHLLAEGQQKRLAEKIKLIDWSQGVGPKLKQILMRGVGVHHAGMLPKYRRIVEDFFQHKLLSVAVCTETLSAGINLPARSILLTTLLKGPPGKKKLIDASSAHQMFGRAGRPQFDDQGYVYVLPHEDDVKLLRWKEKYDQIPEDSKDHGLRAAKKKMKKKMPTRRKNEQYWNAAQFHKVVAAPPGKLYSKGPIPWRLLAYLLDISPEVSHLREALAKRLMDESRIRAAEKNLNGMLMTLWAGGFVRLDPEPPPPQDDGTESSKDDATAATSKGERHVSGGTLGSILQEAMQRNANPTETEADRRKRKKEEDEANAAPQFYSPEFAHPTETLEQLLIFRSVNPLYGVFLINQLGIADRDERIQALESVLEMPRALIRQVRVPRLDELPPGPLATGRLDNDLIQRGLATAEELYPSSERIPGEDRKWPPTLADKLRMLFDAQFPNVSGFNPIGVWSAGELLRQGGDFNKYVTSKNLAKQEGIVFRHMLRLVLLCGEFSQLSPPGIPAEDWQHEMNDISERLAKSCQKVDPSSTEKTIEAAKNRPDVVG